MPIDNSGSQLKPPVTEIKPSERTSLGDKIRSIFNHRSRQNPAETFHQLAQLSSDHPTENHFSPTPTTEITSSSNSDQQEITRLSTAIKQESAQTTTPETSVNLPPLFPDRPSLYDQHHQKYDHERKTLKGKLIRSRDISKLKKSGLDDNGQFYDSLRERGFPRDQIINNVLENIQKPYFGLLQYEYKENLIKQIDHSYSVGVESKTLNEFQKQNSNIFLTNDEDFYRIKNKLDRFSGLRGLDPVFLVENYYSFFSDTPSHQFSSQEFQSATSCLEAIFRNNYPFELHRILPAITADFIKTFPNQEDQKIWLSVSHFEPFCGAAIAKFVIDHKDQVDSFFTSDYQPTPSLSKSLFLDADASSSIFPYYISDLTNSASPQDKIAWSVITNYSEGSFFKQNAREVLQGYTFKQHPEFFTSEHQPNIKFFEHFNSQTDNLSKALISLYLTPEIINTFPSKDQNYWTSVLIENQEFLTNI
nr:hypothetical protein [Candidatus Shapirobacteria bacterium]